MTTNYHYLFKYIIIGDTAVGKSSLLQQFISHKFKEQHEITVGVEFGSKQIQIDGKNIKLQIWDTAGQEDFMSITRSYYRSSAGALVVYDISRRDSFKNVTMWMEEARKNGNENMTFMLIGNKSDLEDERQVSAEEGEEFALQNGMTFIETSAKQNNHVIDAFQQTAENILTQIEQEQIDPQNPNNGIKLGISYVESNATQGQQQQGQDRSSIKITSKENPNQKQQQSSYCSAC